MALDRVSLDLASLELVLVEWIDSAGDDHAWVKPDDVVGRAPSACHSLGYVVDRHDTAITIAQSVGLNEDGTVGELGQVLTIPTGCVRSWTTLGLGAGCSAC